MKVKYSFLVLAMTLSIPTAYAATSPVRPSLSCQAQFERDLINYCDYLQCEVEKYQEIIQASKDALWELTREIRASGQATPGQMAEFRYRQRQLDSFRERLAELEAELLDNDCP